MVLRQFGASCEFLHDETIELCPIIAMFILVILSNCNEVIFLVNVEFQILSNFF